MQNKHIHKLQQWQRHTWLCLCIVVTGLCAASCGEKAAPVKIHRFEQFLFANEGNAADFNTPLLNYNPDDPAFMAALNDFRNDPMVRRLYAVTDSLYHDLSWLEQDLGDAMARAHDLCPEVSYSYFYTLVTADLGNYPSRIFSNLTDMAISIDNYALGHVEELQRFGIPSYITRLCRREYIAADVMAAAARNHIELPEGDMTFLDYAIAEGKKGCESMHRHVHPGQSQTIARDLRQFIELNKNDIVIDSYDNSKRQVPGSKAVNPRGTFEDVRLPLTEEQVKAEANRCLGCGATVVDVNRCIGCGLCTTRCEFDAIHLTRDLPDASNMYRCEDKILPVGKYAAKRAIKILFNGNKK